MVIKSQLFMSSNHRKFWEAPLSSANGCRKWLILVQDTVSIRRTYSFNLVYLVLGELIVSRRYPFPLLFGSLRDFTFTFSVYKFIKAESRRPSDWRRVWPVLCWMWTEKNPQTSGWSMYHFLGNVHVTLTFVLWRTVLLAFLYLMGLVFS